LKTNSNDTIKEVTRTGISILLEEPYLGHFAMGVLKGASRETDSLALSLEAGLPKLIFNPDYWLDDTLDSRHRYGLLKHELLHLSLHHPLLSYQYTHRRIFDIAADLVVNQFIPEEYLPKGAIRLEAFNGFRLAAFQDLDYYYQELLRAVRKGGSGKAATALKELLSQDIPQPLVRHRYWHTHFRSLNSAARRNLIQTIDSLLKTAAYKHRPGKQLGKLPARMQTFLPEHLQTDKPAIDWRRALRLFAASSERTYLKSTIKRSSRRYGTTPGIKIKRRQKILAALDTSGSIELSTFNRFFSELYHIWRQGAEVLVVECDFAIQRQYPYKGKKPAHVQGRGGTDFNAPLRFANEDFFPDAIVYLTDGKAPAPRIQPRMPILWLLSPDGKGEERGGVLPGRVVRMSEVGRYPG